MLRGLYLAVLLFAQSDSAQLAGFIRDAGEAAVPGASVTVINEATGFVREAVTNAAGYYVLSHLPPGLYTQTVEAAGFRRFRETGKEIDANLTTSGNVTLEVGQLSETITVTAPLSAVRSETGAAGKLIDRRQIESIQLNGRNPLFLSLFVPGVNTRDPFGTSLNFGLSSGPLNINGARVEETLITYDGAVGVRTRSNGNSIATANADTLEEIQVLTANYAAEYGRASGGQIRMVTKSGTRDVHGGVFEYLRNSALDANGFERNRVNPAGDRPCSRFPGDPHCRPQPFRYNQFGYTATGPVLVPGSTFNRDRNKMFWSWSQEWVRRRRTAFTVITVPSMAMRRGDFSELLDAGNRFYGRVRVINDPVTGQPFPNNIIPADRLSPNGLALLGAYPEPTSGISLPGANNFYQERPEMTDQRKDTMALDYYPRRNHEIRWRAQLFHFVDVSSFRGGTDRAPSLGERPNQTASAGWIWTVSPSVVNEFMVSGSRDQVYTRVDTRGGRYKRSAYGITYPYILPDRKEIPDKIPNVSFGNVIAELDGGPYPSTSTGPIYVVSDTMTKVWRNHVYKFGGLFERSGQNDFDQINIAGVPGGTNNQNGRFEFRDSRAGASTSSLDLANAALGLFNSYAEVGVRSFTPYRSHMYEWFIQDSWKIIPEFRLEIGVRHSIIQPHYSLWRNMSLFDPAFYDPAIAVSQDPSTGYITRGDLRSRYNGIVIPGSGWPEAARGRLPIADTGQYDFLFRGTPKEYSKTQKRDFQPRIGVAYSLNGKTVIRAGAGRFVTRSGVSDSIFLGGNAPLQPIVSVANGNVDNPAGGTNRDYPLNITTRERDLKNPEAWTWNLTLEREGPLKTMVEVAYVARRGLHLPRERNINQLAPGTLQANPGVNEHALRPYKGFGPIRISSNEGKSRYDSLQLSGSRRFSNRLGYSVAYTYSKLKDDGSDQRFLLPNAFDARNMWGPAAFDRNHVFLMNLVYDVPVLKLTVSAVSQFQSGTPFSAATFDDFAGVGTGSGAQYWIVNGDPKLPRSQRKFSNTNSDTNFWFAVRNADGTPIFTRPAAGTFNTQSVRNIVYGPGFQTHSLALSRDFTIREGHKVRFRVEAFNWPNHPNWRTPSRDFVNPGSSSFGRVNSKESERNIQLSLRYTF